MCWRQFLGLTLIIFVLLSFTLTTLGQIEAGKDYSKVQIIEPPRESVSVASYKGAIILLPETPPQTKAGTSGKIHIEKVYPNYAIGHLVPDNVINPEPTSEEGPIVANKTAEFKGEAEKININMKQPGFEGIFAIIGFLAAACLIVGRKRLKD
jgi:hypothetical protein